LVANAFCTQVRDHSLGFLVRRLDQGERPAQFTDRIRESVDRIFQSDEWRHSIRIGTRRDNHQLVLRRPAFSNQRLREFRFSVCRVIRWGWAQHRIFECVGSGPDGIALDVHRLRSNWAIWSRRRFTAITFPKHYCTHVDG